MSIEGGLLSQTGDSNVNSFGGVKISNLLNKLDI